MRVATHSMGVSVGRQRSLVGGRRMIIVVGLANCVVVDVVIISAANLTLREW